MEPALAVSTADTTTSSPGAPHRGGGLPTSKPGLTAGARDSADVNHGNRPWEASAHFYC